jgi:hypothetical protein
MQILVRPGDGVGSGHVFLSRPCSSSSQANVSGYEDGWKCARYRQFALLRQAGMQQFPLDSPTFNRANFREDSATGPGFSNKAFPS